MNAHIREMTLPMSGEEAASLRLGDMVTLSGMLFTGRSRFHIRAIEDHCLPPLDFAAINCFFHVGPVMRPRGDAWEVVSIEPTSSIRFERYGADVVRRLRLRTLIGKTTMGPATAEALAEVGGVFLSKIGLCGNRMARQVRRVIGVHFLDALGKTEATWVFEVQSLGPLFVAIDAHGNSYFEDLFDESSKRLAAALRDLGVPPDFDYTHVTPRQGGPRSGRRAEEPRQGGVEKSGTSQSARRG